MFAFMAMVYIDLHKRSCTRQGQTIALNPKRFLLLEVFLQSEGRVPTRTMLLERVWDMNFDPKTSVVGTLISRLRRKIKKTVWRYGDPKHPWNRVCYAFLLSGRRLGSCCFSPPFQSLHGAARFFWSVGKCCAMSMPV